MRKFTLLTSVLLTAPFAVGNVSAQCVATQDCASLGYTETSCENGGIKCPFGNAWACKGNADTGTEDSENGRDNPDCTYGAIYYSDGTCVKDFISEKIPIGVVAYNENNEKWIIALADAGRSIKWSTENVDIPDVYNYTNETTAASDLKSCENTDAILALGAEKYPAAKLARDYAPTKAINTKGKWCLPAAGLLSIIDQNGTEINNALGKVGGTKLDLSSSDERDDYWSSTEKSKKEAYTLGRYGLGYDNKTDTHFENISFSYDGSYDSYYYVFVVRPVMKI